MREDCKCKSCGCGKMTIDEMVNQIDDNTLPFTEEIIDSTTIIRTFDPSKIKDHQLKWHWDEQDRSVEPMHDSDWKIQFDNKLPQTLNQHTSYYIKEGTYHRLIKGTDILSLKINKII